MQFHILDENNTPVAVMDNALPEAIHFENSKFHRFLTGSADFFDFDISKIQVDHSFLKVGYWIAFKYGNRDNLLYISDIEEFERDKMMSISSMSQNLDLNLENTPAFAADESYPIKWYFDRILFDSGYEIGINEISDLSRKLSWDSDMTHRVFLQSVATQFDNAELDYEVQLNSDFTIKKRFIHIKKKVGQVREDIELRYGHNVKTVKRKTSINPLYTAIRPISKDDNDKIITIADYPDWQVLDENGNIKFFHKKGEDVIKAPLANAQFGNRGTNINGGGYIVYDYSFDKISQSELFNRSSKMLEDLSVPTVTYDAEGRTGANVGDTVKIVDDGYDPQLIVSARVLEKIDSFDDASIEQASFGNYKALQSQISDDLIGKMQKLAEDNASYKAQTLTTNGLQFKNSTGSTMLTARLYKGTKEIVPDSYVWTKDGTTLSGSTGQRTISATDVNQKAVIRWSATINGNLVAFDEVTITDVSDGETGAPGPKGDTIYPHVAFAYSADGTDRFSTVYPNLNLLDIKSNVVFGQHQNWATATLDNNAYRATFDYVPVTPNATYSISSDWSKTTWLSIFGYGSKADTKVAYVYDGAIKNWFDLSTAGRFVTKNTTITIPQGINFVRISFFSADTTKPLALQSLLDSKPKFEPGPISTPWMPSKSEVKPSDYPSYRGEYSDKLTTQSQLPSDYKWLVFQGPTGDTGATGNGVKTSDVSYQTGASGTVTPTGTWTTSVPTLIKGQYLWTRTIWTYTDNTSNTGYSVSYISVDGSRGDAGDKGLDALNLVLSNQATVIPATYDGSVQSYNGTGTRIDLTEGTTVLQYDGGGVTAGTWKVSATATGITCGAIVDSGAYATVANHSGMAGDSASIEYTITGKRTNGANFTIKASQSFSKSKQGIVGVSSYTWIRYSANSNGSNMTMQPGTDTKYIGLYAGTRATAPTSNIDYTWSNYVGSNGIDGAKGDPTGVTKQATEPASAQRFLGMIWQYTGTASLSITGTTAIPNAMYRWTGTSWELWYFYAANIQADAAFFNLLNVSSATVANLGVTGAINANLIAPTPGNLLFNPEIQSNAWDDGWTQTGSLVSSFYQSAASVTDAGGSSSQMIGINSLSEDGKTSSNWKCFNQDVKIRAGFTYSGSAVLYSSNTNSSGEGIAINILFLDKDKNDLTNASSVTHTVKTYTTIKLENQIAPTGAVYLRFAVIAKGRTNSYATRMMLNIGASVAPYSPNGSALTITGDMIVDGAIKAQKLNVNTLSAISSDIGMMIAGVIKVMADIIINAAGKTKKFGMLLTKKGLLSTGPTFNTAGQASDTKMAVASLTQGELRFINMDYNENLEQVQDSGTSSANNGFIRFSSTAEKGDLLEITASKILLNGYATQTSPWITLSALAKYRVAFGTVTVAVGLINGSSSNTIYLGSIPVELRPVDSRMFTGSAWWVDTSRDRHVQLNTDQGNMSLLNPYPNQEYRFEITWTIPM